MSAPNIASAQPWPQAALSPRSTHVSTHMRVSLAFVEHLKTCRLQTFDCRTHCMPWARAGINERQQVLRQGAGFVGNRHGHLVVSSVGEKLRRYQTLTGVQADSR